MAAESIKYVMLTGLLLLVMYWNNIEYNRSEVSGIDDKYEDLVQGIKDIKEGKWMDCDLKLSSFRSSLRSRSRS